MGIYSPEFIIEKLKRIAKQGRRENKDLSQAQALDLIATELGYNNWSLLSKHIHKMEDSQRKDFHDRLYQNPKLSEYLPPVFPPFNKADAIEEMTAWVRKKFTPLVEFAYFDSEAENGFAWPEEDLVFALNEEFDTRFPPALIEEVGLELELNEGPWGEEDYGDDDE